MKTCSRTGADHEGVWKRIDVFNRLSYRVLICKWCGKRIQYDFGVTPIDKYIDKV